MLMLSTEYWKLYLGTVTKFVLSSFPPLMRRHLAECVCVCVSELILTGVFFLPIQTHWQLKMASLSCAMSLCFFNNQATVWQEPCCLASRKGLTSQNTPKCMCVCVCVHVCSPTDSTLCILVDGETDMTLSYFLSGRISPPQPKGSWTLSFFLRVKLEQCIKTATVYTLNNAAVSLAFLPSCFQLFLSINEAPNERWRHCVVQCEQLELNLNLQLNCVFCSNVATIPK